MPKQTIPSESEGTFARLYDVQEELKRTNTKPLGRPRKKIQRKPTTVHLTPAEKRNMAELKMLLDEHLSINQSELAGIAISSLNALMQNKGKTALANGVVYDIDSFRELVYGFINS
ncbi:hypothetical protein QUF64_15405 [Anaerolineales bacterium HSG6]|nr:hypothetical protein [Anaerolineales bacterium HSG6]MDM8530891.1 hypothetical protein [Anaerolineales bacterium HSG25]